MSVASCRSHAPKGLGAYNLSDLRTYKVVSLFSGCGGIDLGFKGGFDYGEKNFPALRSKSRGPMTGINPLYTLQP